MATIRALERVRKSGVVDSPFSASLTGANGCDTDSPVSRLADYLTAACPLDTPDHPHLIDTPRKRLSLTFGSIDSDCENKVADNAIPIVRHLNVSGTRSCLGEVTNQVAQMSDGIAASDLLGNALSKESENRSPQKKCFLVRPRRRISAGLFDSPSCSSPGDTNENARPCKKLSVPSMGYRRFSDYRQCTIGGDSSSEEEFFQENEVVENKTSEVSSCISTLFTAPLISQAHKHSPESLHLDESRKRLVPLSAAKRSPMSKKKRQSNSPICTGPSSASFLPVVKNSPDLVGDMSRSYLLPMVCGSHRDLKSISADTLAKAVDGFFGAEISKLVIIDCRYPYEYEGGHIKDAINIWNRNQCASELIDKIVEPSSSGRVILVFHCEFSSERGPRMYRFLRNKDRSLNYENYPKLFYPEMYLLHGGYKCFFSKHSSLCTPRSYICMDDSNYATELKSFRKKSKSWNGSDQSRLAARSITATF